MTSEASRHPGLSDLGL